ncbi:E3 ubiquitin-protein ligase PPP1R11 [Uranotaenia lowii]|uniref:E3 ubiquitin-protein ligase PPP1R11 n=1 Tax=Uranotaenia lowii TaxID=190385 RepID=UPI00247B0074|nr:E3 ubiquitin-protein ligase PPP1R11 [Uranotaenia lowii]
MAAEIPSSSSSATMLPEAVTPGGSRTITETLTADQIPGPSNQEAPVLRLRLQKPKTSKKVQWCNGTVDNEHMNKKKSKCCCIYVKPRQFGESSSESEDECEHCFGHVELKKRNKPHPDTGEDAPDGATGGSCAEMCRSGTQMECSIEPIPCNEDTDSELKPDDVAAPT